MTTNESGPTAPSGLPVSTALSEASPLSINDLYIMNPEAYPPGVEEQIIQGFRDYRVRYEKVLQEKPARKAKKDTVSAMLQTDTSKAEGDQDNFGNLF